MLITGACTDASPALACERPAGERSLVMSISSFDVKKASPSGFAPLSDLLLAAREGGYAVGAFNFCNAESAQAIVDEAARQCSPVILLTGPWEIPLLGAGMLAGIALTLARQTDVPVGLHLDHAEDLPLVHTCIEAGFGSVMIDASRYDFEENVRITRMAADMAHANGVCIEGELGAVGRADETAVEGAGGASLTDPARAAEFVERTGVDALAVAIGNAHGIYRQMPSLDFDRLEAIRASCPVPLVLHGGSGTPVDQLARAVGMGMCKVNVASEVSRAYMEAVHECYGASEGKMWYAHALAEAEASVREVVRRWIVQLGSAGRCE